MTFIEKAMIELLLILLSGLQQAHDLPPALVAEQELQAARRGKVAAGMAVGQQRKVGKSGTIYYRFQSKTIKRNMVAQLKYELEYEWANEQQYSGHEIVWPEKPIVKRSFSWVAIPPPRITA
jgi:hypothetical protein